MSTTITISRELLDTPTIDDLKRKVYQIQYQAGGLPPHFIYITEKEWTREKELKAIKADIDKRMGKAPETVTI